MVHELTLYFPLINFGCFKVVILKCHVAFLEMILKRIFLNSVSEYYSLCLMKTSLFLSSSFHQKTFFLLLFVLFNLHHCGIQTPHCLHSNGTRSLGSFSCN